MPIFRVMWQIEVSAATALEAAGKAMIIQRDPRCTHTLFEVSPGGYGEAEDWRQVEVDPNATYDGLLNQDYYRQQEFAFDGS